MCKSPDDRTYIICNEPPSTETIVVHLPGGSSIELPPGGGRKSSWTTTDACEFIYAISTLTTKSGKSQPIVTGSDKTRAVIEKLRRACANQQTPKPAPAKATPTPPRSINPIREPDSGEKMGAPALPTPPAQINPPEPTPAQPIPADPNAPDTSYLDNKEPHPDRSAERGEQTTSGGDPVDLFSGEFMLEENDLTLPTAVMPLMLVRNHRSGAPYFGPFGWNWDHNHNIYIRELADGGIARWTGRLSEQIFTGSGNGYEPPPGVFEKLERIEGMEQGYTITAPGGVIWRFDRQTIDGLRILLTEIADRHGNKLHYSYNPDDTLAEVRDDDGRYLRFLYGNCGLLERIDDSTGRTVCYDHDPDVQHLIRVRFPATEDQPEGSSRCYEYPALHEIPDFRHGIVRVEDGAGRTYVENEYERDPSSWGYGRVIRQLFGGFEYQFAYTPIQYVPASAEFINYEALRVEMLAPDRSLTTYTFNYRGDVLDQRQRLTRDESWRVAAYQYEYDSQGNQTSVIGPDGIEERREYDDANSDPRMRGKLMRVRQYPAFFPRTPRTVWQGTYEGHYQLLKTEKDEGNNLTTYYYDYELSPGSPDLSGKLRRIVHPTATLPDGTLQPAVTEMSDNARGQVTEIISPGGIVERMIYDESNGPTRGLLIEHVIDPDGKAIGEIYTYDTRGYLTSSTDATGSTRGFRHNILGQLVEQSLPAIAGGSPTIALHYDSDGKVVAVDRPRGSYQDVSLPGSHITDRYERDVLGHVVRTEIGANTSVPRITERKVDYRGYPEREIAPDGGRSRFSYDERGLLLRTIVDADDGSKLTERRVYDEAGRLKTVLNGVAEDLAQQQPGDIATRYEYDDLFGRVTHVHMQSGRTIRYTWGERDLLLKEEVLRSPGDAPDSPLIGTSRSFEYDERGRMIRAVEKVFRDDPATATELVTEVYHDADSRIVKIVDPRGGIRRAEYDTAGRKVLEVDPMLNERSFIYRTADRAIDITRRNRQPDGTFTSRTATTVYDERGRLSRLIEPGGAETRTIYDDRDLPVESIIPDGTRRLMSYGLLGEMIEQIDDADDLAIANRWQYDMVGRPLAYLDPTSEMSRYRYDGIGRLVRTDLPGGASVERLYGSDGRIRRQTLASGARIDFTYDAAGRVASLQGSGATGVAPVALHAFTYDELDRLVSATVGGSTVQRAYDNKGRLVSETSHGVTLTGFYDDLAGTAERRWDDGRRELLSTDLNGTVTGIERTAQGTLGGGGASMATFTADGGDLGSADLMGGIHVTAEYDERKRLISILYQKGATTIERADYRYDIVDHRRVETIQGLPAQTRLHRFDAADRLIHTAEGFPPPTLGEGYTQADQRVDIDHYELAASGASIRIDYQLDPADARLEVDENDAPVLSYTYAPGHRLATASGESFTHHIDGPRRSDAANRYEIDAMGRVTRILDASGAVRYTIDYDPLGRVGSLAEGEDAARDFSYFGDTLWQESSGGAPVRQVSWNPMMAGPLAIHVQGESYLTLHDGRMNMLAAADSTGTVRERYRYEAFGLPSILAPDGSTRTSSAIGLEPRFGGMRHLGEAGLYLAGMRLLDPRHGAWVSPDPLGYIDSPNLYAYAGHNPIDYIDPMGRAAIGGSGTPAKPVIKEIDDGRHFQGTAWENFKEGAAAFGEGFRQGLTSTFEFAFNLLWDHEAIPKLAENTWKGAVNTADTAVSLSGLRGWDEKVRMETQIQEAIVKGAKDFWNTPLYDKLVMAGYGVEKIGEQILLTKGAGLVKASMAVSLGLDAVEASPVLSTVLGHVPDPPSAYSVLFQTQLDEAVWGTSDAIHFNRASGALLEAMRADQQFASSLETLIPGISEKTSASSLKRFLQKEKWTWHHALIEQAVDESGVGRAGVLQLVPRAQHQSGRWARLFHPNGFGGYEEWAIPAGARPR